MAKAKVTYFFNKVYEAVDDFKKHMEEPVIKQYDVHIKIISDLAKKFRDAVNKDLTFDQKLFIDKHGGKLFRIHNILSNNDYSIYMNKQILLKLKSPHDIIFMSSLGIKNVEDTFKRLVTSIFNKFVQGITYFKDDHVIDNPIYHREASCGDKQKNHVDKFAMKLTNAAMEKEKKERAVRMCYIERLIYDQIYENVYKTQDLGHKLELHNMGQMFLLYFPGETLTVTVEFDDVYPVKVIIKNNKEVREYYKQWDNSKVYCKMLRGATRFDKVQTYASGETAWMS
jgi:hypothetical protein